MYKFKFKSESIKKYFFENVIDPDRVPTDQCIEEGLPYIDKNGDLRNVNAFMSSVAVHWKNKKYTPYPKGSKGYMGFWNEEKRRCREGMWLGQVRVTGYLYFYLNYYTMKIADKDSVEEGGVILSTPNFWRLAFNFFHLLQYCWSIKADFSLIKPRGVGLTEAASSVGACDFFNPMRDSRGDVSIREHLYYAARGSDLEAPTGIFHKITSAIEWLNEHGQMGMYKATLKINVSDMYRSAGYKRVGAPDVVNGGSFKCSVLRSPDDTRGGRQDFIWWEESGANRHLSGAVRTASPKLTRGNTKVGINIIWGTSNASPDGIEAFKKILVNPFTYGCVGFENVWAGLNNIKDEVEADEYIKGVPLYPFEYMYNTKEEKGHNPNAKGYFISYLDMRVMDSDGNPDRLAAWKAITENRRTLEKGDNNQDTDLMTYKADHPITMEEAFMISGSDYFNRDLLAKQLEDVTVNKIHPTPLRGNLIPTGASEGDYTFNKDSSGKLLVLEDPIKDVGGKKLNNLYIIGYDGIDAGSDHAATGEQGSKMCAVVYKRMYGTSGNMVVAMYLERPGDERDGWNEVIKLALHYNCSICIEDTKKAIVTYLRNKNMYSRLYTRPRIARTDKNKVPKDGQVGVPGHTNYIEHGLKLIKHFINDNWDKICFEDILMQALSYTWENKSKFDTIAALGVALIADEDMSLPLEEKDKSSDWVSGVGFYTDRKGRKRWGVLPTETVILQAKVGRDTYINSNGIVTNVEDNDI